MLEKLEVGKKIEVVIEKQDHFGKGLVKIDGFPIFVKGAIPGDKCLIVITAVKRKFAIAEVIKVIDSSSDRTNPKCKYYGICGGCDLMHQSNAASLLFKENKVREILGKFTNIDNYNSLGIKSSNQFNYRNKVVFHSYNNKLGYYKELSNELVAVDECLLLNKEINGVYKKFLVFMDKNPKFTIKELMIRMNSNNDLMICITGKISRGEVIGYFNEVATIYINDKLIKGSGYLLEEIDGLKFRIYPKSFFQVNYDVMRDLYKKVVSYYTDKSDYKVLDLYCGTGTIGMLVSRYVKEVVGVELEESSIVSANENRKDNGINNISFIRGKVEDHIDSFTDIDSIIVDPPRSGIDKKTIESIIEIRPKDITYVSCDSVTLARDLKILGDYFQIVDVQPFDMFPNTHHVESVSLLSRKNN